MAVDLTVVIVSFQVRDLLSRCLESLARAQGKTNVQVVVVDNASADGSPDMLRARFPDVCLLANSENVGFARANNQGLEIAQGRYQMLLNPDTEIPPGEANPLELLVQFMDTHPRAGACGPSLFYSDGTRQHSAFEFPSLLQIYIDLYPVNWRLRESRLNGRYPRARYEGAEPFLIDHPLGAALMVRSQAIEQIGLLDDEFFMYAEEIDWCMRLKRAGWQVWCVPAARIIHHEARSTRQFREQMFVELWRARFALFRKQYGWGFNQMARVLVRQGMRRGIRQEEVAFARGELAGEDLERRRAAYWQVLCELGVRQ